jgi:phosphoglycolate phosphatase
MKGSTMQYTSILLDLDGTITDSQIGILRCVQYALEACNMPEPAMQKLMPFIGPPLAYSFSKFCGMEEPMLSFAVQKYRERYTAVGWKENRVYDGIPDCLQTLRQHGCRIALATSKPAFYANQILDYFKLTPLFDSVIGSSMSHADETKAEMIQLAMQALGISEDDKSHVLMIGDRKFDAEGAAACGVAFAGVRYGYAPAGELESYPHVHIADTVEDWMQFILS